MNLSRALGQFRHRSLMGVRVLGTGGYAPAAVVTNAEIAEQLGCTSEWIVSRTGIRERRKAALNETTADLCAEAGRRCLANAGVPAANVDLLVMATCTPDALMPATGCLVQHRLGLNCPVVDLHAACAGFLYALITAGTYLISGAAELALITAGDCLSRACDPANSKTASLFGDGAGALLLGKAKPNQGILSYALGADGAGANFVRRAMPKSFVVSSNENGTHNASSYIELDGGPVFRWAVKVLGNSIPAVLEAAGLRLEDVDLVIPHQANLRIIRTAGELLCLPPTRFFTNLERYGNTSAGSVPLALDEAVRGGQVSPGDLVVLCGFGSGLSWGTAALLW